VTCNDEDRPTDGRATCRSAQSTVTIDFTKNQSPGTAMSQ